MKNTLLLSILFCAAFNMRAQCIFVTNCQSSQTVCGLTPNNNLLWNDASWWDPFNQSNDLPDAPSDLFATATDTCSGANLTAKYTLFLDIDRDGVFETVVKSWDPPAPGTVNFNNFNNPNYEGGEPRAFDQRPVPSNQKYQFALETIAAGDTMTARLRWNTQAEPNTFVVPELPYSNTHKIEWKFEDNLSNLQACNESFIVKDCKAPTVLCINGISVNVLPGGYVTLWATDFLTHADDNATGAQHLKFGIRKSGTGTGFPVDGNGDPILKTDFTCWELGNKAVELWAIDLAGNANYCETYVLIQDNAGFCNGEFEGLVVCIRRSCDDAIVTGVDLSITGAVNFAPPFGYFGTNSSTLDQVGCWTSDSTFSSVPITANLVVTPIKESEPLNGVTPLDLLKIARHILGIEPLQSYNIIAADANKSNSISSFDIIELRKLLQGVYQELPFNTSWRFIDANYVFPNPANPFQASFPEINTIGNILLDTLYETAFIAVKIGDVDCDAVPGLSTQTDDRQVKYLSLPDARMEAGSSKEIPLSFTEAGDWVAMQLGLQYDPSLLDIEAILPGELPDLESGSFAEPGPGLLNMVWFTPHGIQVPAQKTIFTLRLRAKQALQLRQTLQLTQRKQETPRLIQAEAYDIHETAFNFELLFQEQASGEAADQNFIYQPQPNPTANTCAIPIRLMQAEVLHITLADVSGKLLWQQEKRLSAGLHRLEVPAEVMTKAGVYSWRVETGGVVATGKIVRI
jgi:Cohesin domain